jgi:serine protease Do
MNPRSYSGISIGYAVGSVAEGLRQITVRVSGSRGSRGSGVIWLPRGLIVTNAHVADSAVHTVEFSDGRRSQGWLVGRDPGTDLAALAVSDQRLPSASVRSARGCRAGELVIAVGNPVDGEGAVSTGIIHRPPGERPFLFADIRLAPGNSGGPLADAQGNVIGINSAVVNSLGCAVTSDAVQDFLRRSGLATITPRTNTCPQGPREAA